MDGKLQLPRVSLVAVDTLSPGLAARALRRCLDHCDFADAVLLTDRAVDAPCRVGLIPRLPDRRAYSHFIVKQLVSAVRADFVLIAQWDGHVVDPGAWRDEFLDHDYIGARWPWFDDGKRVGNGGFSLRSRKLLEILASPLVPPPGDTPEDLHICRTLRPTLEERWGIRFAPDAVADAFSREWSDTLLPSFGFHGLSNIWRYNDDGEMQQLILQLHPSVLWSLEYLQLIVHYINAGRSVLVGFMYLRMAERRSYNKIKDHFERHVGDKVSSARLLAICARASDDLHFKSRT